MRPQRVSYEGPQHSDRFTRSPQPKVKPSAEIQIQPTASTAEKTALKLNQHAQVQNNGYGNMHKQQTKMCFSWGTITYRDSVYYGRVAHVKKQLNNKSEHQQNEFDDQHNQDCRRLKDGPGILMLDCAFWVIANWSRDQLSGNFAYVITADLGILRIQLSLQRSMDITQLSWIGTTEKTKDQMKQCFIVGAKQQKQTDKFNWTVKVQDSISSTTQHFIKTQSIQPNTQINSKRQFKFLHYQKVKNEEHHQYSSRTYQNKTNSFKQFIGEIRNLLKCQQAAEQGFKVKSVVTLEQTKIVHSVNQRITTKNSEVLLYSSFRKGPQIQIKINNNQETVENRNSNNESSAKKWYFINEITIGNKCLGNSNQIVSPRQYLYRVRTASEYLANNYNKVRIPIFAIQQQLSANRQDLFRYQISCDPQNIKHDQAISPAFQSSQQQYRKCRIRKANYHLGSLSLVNSRHTKLKQSIDCILLNIYELYYYIRHTSTAAVPHQQLPGQVVKETTNSDLQRQVNKIKSRSINKAKSYSNISAKLYSKKSKQRNNDCHECSDRYRYIESMYDTKTHIKSNLSPVMRDIIVQKPDIPDTYLARLTDRYASLEDQIKLEASRSNLTLVDFKHDQPSWKQYEHQYDLKSTQLRNRYREMLTRIKNKFP